MSDILDQIINKLKDESDEGVIEAMLIGFEAYHKTMKGFLENYKQDSISKLNLGVVVDHIYKTGAVDIKNMKGLL